jgi:hypothetical protein
MALEGIIEAMMRGNAELQGQEEVKREVKKQDDGLSKTSLTFNADGTATIKNVDPTMLNPTAAATNVQQAYEAPKLNVERALEQQGFKVNDPRKFRDDPTSIDSFGERYAARRKLGGGVISSALMAGVLGGSRDEALRENRGNQVARANSINFQRFVKPVMDEEQDEAQIYGQLRGQALQGANMKLQERNRLLDQKNIIQYGDEDSYLQAVDKAMAPFGGLTDTDRDLFSRAFQTGRVSFMNERLRALSGEEGKNSIVSYAPDEFGKFVEEQVGANVFDMNETERSKFMRTFTGLQKHKADQDLKQQMTIRKAERDEELLRLREETAARVATGQMTQMEALAKERNIDNFYKMADKVDTLMKPYADIEKQASKVQALAAQKTGEADYAIIMNFVSSIDNSVARESEVATARSTVDLASQAKLMLAKWKEGDLLDDNLRARFVSTTNALVKSLEPHKQQTLKSLRSRADAMGVDFDRITGGSEKNEKNRLGLNLGGN